MLTKRQINAGLPNVGTLRRVYRFWWQSDRASCKTFRCAFMDLDGIVTVYGYGDAMEPRHYYREYSTDVTREIGDWIAGELDRRDVVGALQARARKEF